MLPKAHKIIASLESDKDQLRANLDFTTDNYYKLTAHQALREKKHKEQLKKLKAELLVMIDGSSPKCNLKWIEMGLRRAILRDPLIQDEGALMLAESMIQQTYSILPYQIGDDYFPGEFKSQFQDLMRTSYGREVFTRMAHDMLKALPKYLEVHSDLNYEGEMQIFIATCNRYNLHIAIPLRTLDLLR